MVQYLFGKFASETMFRSDIRISEEEEDDIFPIVCQDTKGHPNYDNLRLHSYLKVYKYNCRLQNN